MFLSVLIAEWTHLMVLLLPVRLRLVLKEDWPDLKLVRISLAIIITIINLEGYREWDIRNKGY